MCQVKHYVLSIMEQIKFSKDYTNAKSYTQLFHLLEMIENQPKFEIVVKRSFLFSLYLINHRIKLIEDQNIESWQ